MKVVLDTNVVVSGLLSPFGGPGEIVRMAASGDIELAARLRETSRARYGRAREEVEESIYRRLRD